MPLCRRKWVAVTRMGKAIVMAFVLCTGLATGEEVVELSPLVVEGRHFDELAMDLPLAATRIEKEDLDRSGARSVPEALERLAGIRMVDTAGNGATGQVSLRGFGDNSGLRTLILLDGQVYNPPDMGSINWLGIEVEELQAVEVLHGGQTVIYGNHAVSGVIKLTSRRIGSSGRSTVTAGWGSDEDYRFKASLSGVTGEWGLQAGVGWQQSAGYREHAALSSRALRIRWENDRPRGGRWAGGAIFTRTGMELPGPLTHDRMLADPRASVSGQSHVDTDTLQLTQYGEGVSTWGRWEIAAGYLKRDAGWDLAGLHADNKLERLTANPRLKFDFEKGYLISGVDLSHDQVDHTGYLSGDRTIKTSVAEIQRLTSGGYIFISRDLVHDVRLSGGIRLESASTDNSNRHYRENQLLPEYETNRGTIPNPDYKNPPDLDPDLSFEGTVEKSGWAGELSLLWKVGRQFSLWAGWDRVYRYPALDETAAYQGYPLSDPLNENLDPEVGDNFELGMKQTAGRWQASVTAYYLRLDDEISFSEYEDPSGNGFVRINENIGDSDRKGIEAQVSWQSAASGWKATVNWIDATLSTANRMVEKLPLVPGLEAGLSFWVKPVQSLRIQMHCRYLDEQVQGNDFENDLRRIPAYYLANASLHWDAGENLDLIAGINNLFDKAYAATAYSGGFYPGSGRQAYLTLKMGF